MTLRFGSPAVALPPGLLFEVARDRDIAMRGNGNKRQICCPFHEDKHASAFLSNDNIYFCSCCTPNGGWPAKRFVQELGLNWDSYMHRHVSPTLHVAREPKPTFTPADAQATWKRAFARARDDDAIDRDRAVYEYLHRRGLAEAWELGAFGIVTGGSDLHPALARWVECGYRLLVPLFDQDGEIANVQARTVHDRTPKTMLPAGSRVAGTMFADRRGQALLRGEAADRTVILGEGLTDTLALTIASPVPVIAAPGTSNAVNTVGPWARGRHVLLALDVDAAGEIALKPTAAALYAHGAKHVQRVVWPGGAKDACDVVAQRGVVGLESFLKRQLVGIGA
jgi:hypothetical protein